MAKAPRSAAASFWKRGTCSPYVAITTALQGLRASSHELVLCGHTHHAHLHTFAELRLLNAGTLVRDQHPCFVLLDFDAPSAGIYDLGATTSPRTQHAL